MRSAVALMSSGMATRRARSSLPVAARALSSGTGGGSSSKPKPTITAAPAPPHKNITLHSLAAKTNRGEPITMVTAYDYPSAVHVDKAGIDILLVSFIFRFSTCSYLHFVRAQRLLNHMAKRSSFGV